MSNVSKEQKARLYDQWGIISKLVRDGKRDPDEVSRALQEIISSSKKLDDVVQVKSINYDEPVSHRRAREIMGKNFLGIPEVDLHFAITPFHLEVFEEIPFPEGVLRECADTHILVADIGLSILHIRKRAGKLFYSQDWYKLEEFAREPEKPQWRLIKKSEVPNSTGKTWQEQQELVTDTEEISTARAMVYAIILNYLDKGERMLEHMYVRTSSIDSDGYHVHVGHFDSHGLSVSYDWGVSRDSDLGLASARK